MDLNLPVTLVVKAPNQRFADQKITCGIGWTIKKLKEHLASVYPSKPVKESQKLIYSGRLLSDHLMLKDILRQYEEESTHTVHLVCTPTKEELARPISTTPYRKVTSVDTNPSVSSSMNSSEGLRHRGSMPNLHPYSHMLDHHRGSVPDFIPHTQVQSANNEMYQQYIRMHLMSMYPGYSQEQITWLQQMYMQQMNQYMQYMHHLHGTVPTATTVAPPATAASGSSQVGQAAGADPAPIANDNNQQPANANQNMVMNAQGGLAMMEDDNDGNNGDWLDYFYMVCQILVLFSICYFYSTFSRALLAFLFFVAMYLYQVGWFQLQRRQVPPEPQQAEQAQPQPNPVPEPDNNETDQPVGQDEDPNRDRTEDATGNTVQEIQAPNYFQLVFTFFWTFFSSLIPQPPAPLNLN